MSKKHRKQLKQFGEQVNILKGTMASSMGQLDDLISKLPIEQQESLRDLRLQINRSITNTSIEDLDKAIIMANEEIDKTR